MYCLDILMVVMEWVSECSLLSSLISLARTLGCISPLNSVWASVSWRSVSTLGISIRWSGLAQGSVLWEQPCHHIKMKCSVPRHLNTCGFWVGLGFCWVQTCLFKLLLYICCLWFCKGAKKEGAAGFFKGIGKGLVGAVARPTGGIIDMASSTFQGIQR